MGLQIGSSIDFASDVKSFGPLLRQVPAILHADAELAGNVDPGLVGETHAGLERRAIGAHEVRRLVPVHANAVAGAVGGPGQSIVLGPAEALVVLANGDVDVADRDTDLGGLERDLLAALHGVPDLAVALAGRTENPGAGNVRRITVELAAGIDEYHRALADGLRVLAAVRIGTRLVE